MAAFFWIAAVNSNWNQIGNWSATSGGVTNGATPTATSDVTFDGAGVNGNNASTVNAGMNTLSITFTSGYTNTVTINTGVVLQVAAAGSFTDNTAHSWVVNGTGQLVFLGASTINSGGKTFPGAVQFAGNTVIKTLSVDWTVTGTLTISGTPQTINGNILNLGAGLTSISKAVSGTTKLVFNGTGTIDTSSGGSVANNVDINTAGTITITAFTYLTGTLKFVAASAITGTLTIGGSCTLDIAGITWSGITFATTGTVTVSSLITATTIAINSGISVTFAGSFGFTCTTFTVSNTSNQTHTFVNGVTYTITGTLNAFSSAGASPVSFVSNDGTLRANIVLLNDSSICNVCANFTRINASGGRPIVSFNGTITDCINVASFANVLYMPVASLNRGKRRYGVTDKNKSVMYQ